MEPIFFSYSFNGVGGGFRVDLSKNKKKKKQGKTGGEAARAAQNAPFPAQHSAYSTGWASKNQFWPLATSAKHHRAPCGMQHCYQHATGTRHARVATLRARAVAPGTKKAPQGVLSGVMIDRINGTWFAAL